MRLLTRLLEPKAIAHAHCDLPCGVYDPAQARIEAESVKAIAEKYAQNTDPDVMKRMEQALADLQRQGAQIVDPIQIAEIDSIPPGMLFCFRFKFDINDYLPRLGPDAPVKNLDDIIKSAKFHPSIEKRLLDRQA